MLSWLLLLLYEQELEGGSDGAETLTRAWLLVDLSFDLVFVLVVLRFFTNNFNKSGSTTFCKRQLKHLLESQTGLYSKTEQPKQQKMSTPVQDENLLRVSSLIEKSKKLLLNLDLERVPLSKLQELNNSLVKEWNEIAKKQRSKFYCVSETSVTEFTTSVIGTAAKSGPERLRQRWEYAWIVYPTHQKIPNKLQTK